MRKLSLVGLMALAGCTKTVVQQAGPVGAPAAVAGAFMQAVSDSNLTQMGELWGTSKGSAASTNTPSNWLQRVAVIHAYLKGGTHRVLGEEAGLAKADRRQINIELSRGGCSKTVPLTMVLTKQGSWLVNAIDLNAAGVPGRPCDGSATKNPTPPGGAFIR